MGGMGSGEHVRRDTDTTSKHRIGGIGGEVIEGGDGLIWIDADEDVRDSCVDLPLSKPLLDTIKREKDEMIHSLYYT